MGIQDQGVPIVETRGTFIIEKQAAGGARVLVLPPGGEAPYGGRRWQAAHDRALQEDRSTPSNMLPWRAQFFVCPVAVRSKAAGCAWTMGCAAAMMPGASLMVGPQETTTPSSCQPATQSGQSLQGTTRGGESALCSPADGQWSPCRSTSDRSWVALSGLALLGRALLDRPAFRALVRRPLRHEPAHRLRVALVYRAKSPRCPSSTPAPHLTIALLF
jgi:hypothetical protein